MCESSLQKKINLLLIMLEEVILQNTLYSTHRSFQCLILELNFNNFTGKCYYFFFMFGQLKLTCWISFKLLCWEQTEGELLWLELNVKWHFELRFEMMIHQMLRLTLWHDPPLSGHHCFHVINWSLSSHRWNHLQDLAASPTLRLWWERRQTGGCRAVWCCSSWWRKQWRKTLFLSRVHIWGDSIIDTVGVPKSTLEISK